MVWKNECGFSFLCARGICPSFSPTNVKLYFPSYPFLPVAHQGWQPPGNVSGFCCKCSSRKACQAFHPPIPNRLAVRLPSPPLPLITHFTPLWTEPYRVDRSSGGLAMQSPSRKRRVPSCTVWRWVGLRIACHFGWWRAFTGGVLSCPQIICVPSGSFFFIILFLFCTDVEI